MNCPECGHRFPSIRKPANLRQVIWGGWTCQNCGIEFNRFGGRITPYPPTAASTPGMLTISKEKLRVLRPDLYGFDGFLHALRIKVGLSWDQLRSIDLHLQKGDSRAAMVVSPEPLLVAAYTDELDCVAILRFPDHLADDYGLEDGTQLLTVNTYSSHHEPHYDLFPGPKDTGHWNGFYPLIADFVSDDVGRIDAIKNQISNDEWNRAYRMGKEYIARRPGVARDGRPIYSSVSAVKKR